ncbi:MAG: hypothetical protein ABI744_04920 [Chloroflexota bacterium]
MTDPNGDDAIEDEEREPKRREPAVVPAISSEQPLFGADLGQAAYATRPEENGPENDQESHASPSDNDGETVPRDEVVDDVDG